MRNLFIAAALLLLAVQSVQARDAAGLYAKSCTFCHASGVSGAPKTGDSAAWKARVDEKGMDKLVVNARDGFKAMPPKGMCMDCSDEEFKSLIEYMSTAK